MRLKNVLYSSLVFSLAIILTYGTSPINTSGFGPGPSVTFRSAQPYAGKTLAPTKAKDVRHQGRARITATEEGRGTGI